MKQNTKKFFSALVLFGLMGQIAWVIENMYLNVFLYKMFHASAEEISLMVTASAVAAAVTTILIGALSDRVGKRRLFLSLGYILWGISIFGFVFLKPDTLAALFPTATSIAAIGITLTIVFDCLMTFFGSSANDAAFNAWLTEAAEDNKRGAAEGINAMMPLVAILAVFGGFMAFDLDKSESWTSIFTIIAAATVLIGILGFFLIDDDKTVKSDIPYLKSILHGFLPSTVKRHPRLYLSLLAFTIFNISIQIFMPYLILYYEVSLQMTDYVFIMAPAIILASIVTALWGRVYDKKGLSFSLSFSLAFLLIGYLMLYLVRSTLPVFVGSLFMMSGFLAGGAVFGAKIRKEIPVGKAGMFQGVRIVSQVLLPGIIGPSIASAILKHADKIVNTDGTESFIPSANIFLAAFLVVALLSAGLLVFFFLKKPKTVTLSTDLASESAWQSHPRPQMTRENFQILNGKWQLFKIKKGKDTKIGEITLPFVPESALSGIGETLKKGEAWQYAKQFPAPAHQNGEKVILHFGAVDAMAVVSLNGETLGVHAGGYHPFSYDITPYLQEENTLSVVVSDTTSSILPYGKQRKRRGGMWYTPVSGIWQSVWLEVTPEQAITDIAITPKGNTVTIKTQGGLPDKTLTLDSGKAYSYQGDSLTITLENARFWSPDDPYLYSFTLSDGCDSIKSYFALRDFTKGVANGKPCLFLNGKPIFLHGLLDQGYYPDGIFTPASEKGYTFDIETAKACGFNMLRKHIKIEPERFYYDCDRLGMIVMQDLVNAGRYAFIRDTALPTLGIKQGLHKKKNPTHAVVFKKEAEATLRHLYNHPCIVAYTIFNEGWGQFDADGMYDFCRAIDPTRLYDTTSGWFFEEKSDFQSEHIYFKKLALTPWGDKPLFLSEFGGYSLSLENHVFNLDKTYGYRKFDKTEELEKAILSLYENEVIPMIEKGLTGAVYTQLSDVEDETNGILTYDRRVLKVDPAEMSALADTLFAAHKKVFEKEE